MSRPTGEGVLQAEQAVLGAVLVDPGVLAHLDLSAADFVRPEHQHIFEAARALDADGVPVDPVVVGERMGGARIAYLAELADNCAAPSNAPAYAAIVRRAAVRRQALAALAEAQAEIQRGDRPVPDIVAALAADIDGLAADHAGGPVSFAGVVSRALDVAHAAHQRRRQGGTVGAPSGLPALDARLGGLHGPRLVILAGRPGVGKTALASQWALHAAERGYKVGVCSLEMSDAETGLRALAVLCGLNSAALARGAPDEYERLRELVAAGKLEAVRQLPIHFDFDSFTLGAVVARISQWRRTEKIDLAVVDHIGLIETEGYTSRVEQLGAISRTLKKLAKRIGIPIVALSQLNRTVEREKRLPVLSDLRDSGSIEQDADAVIMLHAPGDPDALGKIDVEIGLLKLRDGVKGWLPCKFQFDGRAQRFREIAASGRSDERFDEIA